MTVIAEFTGRAEGIKLFSMDRDLMVPGFQYNFTRVGKEGLERFSITLPQDYGRMFEDQVREGEKTEIHFSGYVGELLTQKYNSLDKMGLFGSPDMAFFNPTGTEILNLKDIYLERPFVEEFGIILTETNSNK